MKTTSKILAALLVLTLLVTGVSFARGRKGPARTPYGRHLGEHGFRMRMMGSCFLTPMMVQELNLTDAQISKLEKIRAAHQKKMIDLRAQMAKLNVDLRLMMSNLNFDTKAVESKMRAISDMRLKMQIERLNTFKEALSVLNKTQKDKLQKMWDGRYFMRMGTQRGFGRGYGRTTPPPAVNPAPTK